VYKCIWTYGNILCRNQSKEIVTSICTFFFRFASTSGISNELKSVTDVNEIPKFSASAVLARGKYFRNMPAKIAAVMGVARGKLGWGSFPKGRRRKFFGLKIG